MIYTIEDAIYYHFAKRNDPAKGSWHREFARCYIEALRTQTD